MRTRPRLPAVTCAAIVLGSLLSVFQSESISAAPETSPYLKDIQTGSPGFKSIGRMSFGPYGVLLVADPRGAAIVAINTGDRGPVVKLKKRVDNVDVLIAALTGGSAGFDRKDIKDMVVNPESGRIYLSVHRKQGNRFAILTVDADGKIGPLDLKKVHYVRVTLAGGENSTVRTINNVAFAEDRVLATGLCKGKLANKIFSIPLPLKHGTKADIFSAEIYHTSHRRWETNTPIQAFIPFQEKGKHYLVGGFGCTPIVKFPLDGLASGDKVRGDSIIELGSGNRPLDMFTYEKDGRSWLVTNTFRFHFKKNLFGPSKWWGVRVDTGYLSTDKVNEKAIRRNTKAKTGPEGIEIVDALFGAIEVDKLNNDEIVVLRDRDDNGKLDLELARLP